MSKRNIAQALAYKAKPRPIDSLVPNPSHARTHDADGIRKAARQIGEFGFTMPILVKPDGKTIIAGHRRWEAARLLELPDVPVIVADGWSEKQCRAYALADNRLAEDGKWDDEALARELQFLVDADFDVGLAGFADDEVASILASEAQQEKPDPEVPLRGVSEPGDVWLCMSHEVHVGADDVMAADGMVCWWQETTGEEAILLGTDRLTYSQVGRNRHGGVSTGKGKVRARAGGA